MSYPLLSRDAPLTPGRLQREVPFDERQLAFMCRAHVPLLGGEVTVSIASEPEATWTPYCVEALRMVLGLHADLRSRLQDLLLESYRFHASVTDYGPALDPEDPFNIADRAEALQQAGAPRIDIAEPYDKEGIAAVIAMIGYTPVWEDEHGVYVVVRDHQLVGLASDPYDTARFDGRAG